MILHDTVIVKLLKDQFLRCFGPFPFQLRCDVGKGGHCGLVIWFDAYLGTYLVDCGEYDCPLEDSD